LKNIFVGNLDFNTTEEEFKTLFRAYGEVESVTIVKDRDTGQSRGFAFVEMPQHDAAQVAIRALDGALLKDRTLRLNEARPKLVPDSSRNSFRSRDHRRHQI
jgi:cold-inducible RNA-binding protein